MEEQIQAALESNREPLNEQSRERLRNLHRRVEGQVGDAETESGYLSNLMEQTETLRASILASRSFLYVQGHLTDLKSCLEQQEDSVNRIKQRYKEAKQTLDEILGLLNNTNT